jgi:hypothetical protein
MKKFVSTMRKGFHITFENGLQASVQWGAGNYCDNHFSMDFMCSKDAESNTAEVAVFKGDTMIDATPFVTGDSGYDSVVGYLTPEQVVDFLMNVKNYKEA